MLYFIVLNVVSVGEFYDEIERGVSASNLYMFKVGIY